MARWGGEGVCYHDMTPADGWDARVCVCAEYYKCPGLRPTEVGKNKENFFARAGNVVGAGKNWRAQNEMNSSCGSGDRNLDFARETVAKTRLGDDKRFSPRR